LKFYFKLKFTSVISSGFDFLNLHNIFSFFLFHFQLWGVVSISVIVIIVSSFFTWLSAFLCRRILLVFLLRCLPLLLLIILVWITWNGSSPITFWPFCLSSRFALFIRGFFWGSAGGVDYIVLPINNLVTLIINMISAT